MSCQTEQGRDRSMTEYDNNQVVTGTHTITDVATDTALEVRPLYHVMHPSRFYTPFLYFCSIVSKDQALINRNY